MSRLALASAVAVLHACTLSPPPVRWGEVSPLTGGTSSVRQSVSLSAEGVPSTAAPYDSPVVTQGAVCPGTISVAPDGTGGAFAAWWAPREDGSAALVVARRKAGAGMLWETPVIADPRDRSSDGCDRAAPAIAADGARGYVHLSYYVDAPEGAGIYGGHSMERGEYFHGPVAVVYGDRPARTAIATSGDLVAIAYEDPNSARPRVALAISESAGHLFEHRLPASPPSAIATDPQVALRGRWIAVAWSAESWAGRGEPGGQRVVRVGELGDNVKTSTSGGRGETDRRTHDR